MEAVTRNCQLLSTASPHSEVEQKVLKSCYQCGKTNHTASNCYFKDTKCHNCDKLGNIAKVCHSKSRQQPKNCNVKLLQGTDDASSGAYIKNKNRTKPPQVIMVNLLTLRALMSHM